MKKLILLSSIAFAASAGAQNVDKMYDEFSRVPDSTRTKVWWFHGENTTTEEGIRADLEAYSRAGVGGVVYYDQQHGPGTPDAAPSMSPTWWYMRRPVDNARTGHAGTLQQRDTGTWRHALYRRAAAGLQEGKPPRGRAGHTGEERLP